MYNYHENPETLHVNTLPTRAYFIPFPDEKAALADERETSDRLTLLSGTWEFAYFPSLAQMPEEIAYADTIPVPSVWQMHGYDHHQYTNVRYPFPYDPPYVPADNPVGAYRRAFTLQKKEHSLYQLHFEGVDSCLYLHVNGTFAGFSQVSHSTSAFDITDLLVNGENTLEVRVLKWCFGSYLEDQDKFRMSGIFRDVYLLERSECARGGFQHPYRAYGYRSGGFGFAGDDGRNARPVADALCAGRRASGKAAGIGWNSVYCCQTSAVDGGNA